MWCKKFAQFLANNGATIFVTLIFLGMLFAVALRRAQAARGAPGTI